MELNNLHPCLKFTSEVESGESLSFLDVLVHKREGCFVTQVFRKPTFTGEYTRWNSFCDQRRKISLIKTLTHRALKLCSDEFLDAEVQMVKSILYNNSYPEAIVRRTIDRKIETFKKTTEDIVVEQPAKTPVYLRLPYIGQLSDHFRKKITTAIKRCYDKVNPRVILTSRVMLP